MQLQPSTLLQGRYRVVGLLARGGMGAVYKAVDERLGHTVALKQTLMADPALTAAFEREARLLAGLQHPSLPVVSDHFAEGGGQFLVMQFIPGDDLAALLHARGAPFLVDQVLAWAEALLDALTYLHSQQPPIIHRDIKPQNLKLTPQGRIILLDFGLAKGVIGTAAAPPPSLFGYTPQYAPIEQIQGTGTDARSDLYALAATLVELLTGAPPPDALTRASALLKGEPDPLRPLFERSPTLPPHLSAALAGALALDPSLRPPSAVAMRAALLAVAPTQAARSLPGSAALPPPATGATIAVGSSPPVTGVTVALDPPRRRLSPLLIALPVLGVLLVLGLVAVVAARAPGPGPISTAVAVTAGVAATAPASLRGASFADPVPYGQEGAFGPLTLRVVETMRGREAWNAMRKANQFNDPPPVGHEYFLVRLALAPSADLAQIYPRLAGERRVLYAPGGVSPAPLPEAFSAGQRVEAWLPYMVAEGEADLVIHLDDLLGEPSRAPLFLAADEGARLEPDPTLERLLPDELGVSHREPVPPGETTTMEDFTLTLLEARRGPEVIEELAAHYAGVQRPREGYEYALVRLRVRYIGDGGVIGWADLGSNDFASVSTTADDPEGQAIDHPRVYVLPDSLPSLDVNLLPGGEREGWTVIELPVGAEAMALVFSPSFDYNGLNTRYFALE